MAHQSLRSAPLGALGAATVALGVVVVALAVTGAAAQPQAPATASADAVAADPVVVAAGDIGCPTTHQSYNGGEGTATECRQKHTSELILGADHVFMVGDGQYYSGSLTQYESVYDATWGRKKSVTYPAPGDHEYATPGAAGYFSYFGVEPYYSFDIGSWHWVSLNSEIPHEAGSPQERWLTRDLADTSQPCVGAFWATPRFSSGRHGGNATFDPFWDALYAARADVVLAGDDHDYERFAKQAPDGSAAADGIRQFVVGTGGRSLYPFKTTQPHSQVRAEVFGVLQLRLGARDYGWEFLTESGGPFADSGTTACNGTATEPPASAARCYRRPATIVGTRGADMLVGTAGDDVIVGLGGNDSINGRDGNDRICAAAGSDKAVGGAGHDKVKGGAASDSLTDRVGGDLLAGAAGRDTLRVADGVRGDTANGGVGVDTCRIDKGDKVTSCE